MNKIVYLLCIGGLLFVWSCKGTKTTSQKVEKKDIINTHTSTTKKFVPTADRLLYEEAKVIKKIQVILYLNNYPTGRVNGEMTAETLRALAAFQKDHGIKEGDRSARTLNAMGVPLMNFDIDVLQEKLAQKGFEVGIIDGILGPKTRVAYQTFLRKNNLSGLGFSEEIKEILMKEDTAARPAIEKQPTPSSSNSSFVPETTNSPMLPSVAVQQVQEALFRKGYDPGDKNGILSPQTQDALFKYQVDKLLPIGGFNEDTMRSLGL